VGAAALLEGREIVKDFPGTRALDGVSFRITSGRIHALLGENGAGKSTLVRIMSGVMAPDQGRLLINGEDVTFDSPQSAHAAGIAVVHQELSLIPSLTVAENLSLVDPPRSSRPLGRVARVLDRNEMRRRATLSLAQLNVTMDVNMRVAALSPARRQLIEIAKSASQSSRVVLLDEPTSSLSPGEREELFSLVRQMRDGGMGIVFITHLLNEAISLSDDITVLRDGRLAGAFEAASTTEQQLIESMTGRTDGAIFPGIAASGDSAVRLAVHRLGSGSAVRDVSLSVRAGEVLGLAGVVGAGRTETLEAIVGLRTVDSGEITMDNRPVRFRSPRQALAAGVALIPEDRQLEGIFHGHSVARNICISYLNNIGGRANRSRRHIIRTRSVNGIARTAIDEFSIKTRGTDSVIDSLSGGNQQKVILARCLATKPIVVLADEPTRGVSIGGKMEIYQLLRAIAARGTAVIVVSTEFEELAGLCDRITVIRRGVTVGDVHPPLTGDALLGAVLGLATEAQ